MCIHLHIFLHLLPRERLRLTFEKPSCDGLAVQTQVCVGCQKVLCILLYGSVCVRDKVCVQCQKVSCFLLYGRSVFRGSESLLYRSVCVQDDVSVGCQKDQHIRVHAIICIFWHPTYLCFCPVTAPSRCSPCSYSNCNVAASCRPT